MGSGQSTIDANVAYNTNLPTALIDECVAMAPRLFIRFPLFGAEFARFYHLSVKEVSDENLKLAMATKIEAALAPVSEAKNKTLIESPKEAEEVAAPLQPIDAKVVEDALAKIIEINESFIRDFVCLLPKIQEKSIRQFLRTNKIHFVAGIEQAAKMAPVERDADLNNALNQSVLAVNPAKLPIQNIIEDQMDDFTTEGKRLVNLMLKYVLKTMNERLHKYLLQILEPNLELFPTIKASSGILPLLSQKVQSAIWEHTQ